MGEGILLVVEPEGRQERGEIPPMNLATCSRMSLVPATAPAVRTLPRGLGSSVNIPRTVVPKYFPSSLEKRS